MFSSIAFRYDLLNRLISFGLDKVWRRRAAMEMDLGRGKLVLDLATGTGDMAIEMASVADEGVRIVGIDFNLRMLMLAKEKSLRLGLAHTPQVGHGVGVKIEFSNCMVEKLPFKDNSFDYLSIAFGIRNLPDVALGLAEMRRVLKRKGKVIILELSMPKGRVWSKLYLLHLSHLIPFLGGLLSEKDAYRYLADSIKKFPSPEAISSMMERVGFKNVQYKSLTYGVITIYVGEK